MKTKSTSTFEIRIDNIFVGIAVNVYFNNGDNISSVVTTEFIPYSVIKTIPNIKLNDEYKIYQEDKLKSINQDKIQIENLLKSMVLNIIDYKVDIILKRQSFDLKLDIDGNTYKGHLIHEHSFSPNYKQVQMQRNNKIFRFNISKDDNDIINEIKSHFK